VLTLDAEIVARSERGTRTIAAADFFRSYLSTALDPDELLVALRFPATAPGTGTAFVELAPRKGDYALVGVAAQVVLAEGRIERAALGYLGAGSTPLRAAAAEAVLAGAEPTADAFAEAAARAESELQPLDDIHASAAYRRRVAGVLTRRALAIAVRRARGDDHTEEEL
jgi:carbon-monoxide dehydrogenase medium subunit